MLLTNLNDKRTRAIRLGVSSVVAALAIGLAGASATAADPAPAEVVDDITPYLEDRSAAPGDAAVRESSGDAQAVREARRARGGSFLKGYAEPRFVSNKADQTYWFDQSANANTNVARINIRWRAYVTGEPAAPTNPADPAYNLEPIDEAVKEAAARGQRIVLTLYSAPDWAEGPNRPAKTMEWPTGTWKPDPEAFGDFAQAVASRYSGEFPVPGVAALPRVDYLMAWNEPNLTEYITPQSVKKRGKFKLTSADHYRKMVNAASEGIGRSLNPSAKVIAGATSPYGDDVGGRRTRPLEFARDFLCLNSKLKRKGCKGGKAEYDIYSHHPITLSGGPNRSAIHRDDVAMPDLKNLVKTVKAAAGSHPVWVTEFWWETDPPDATQGVAIQKHARWVQESLYSMWRQGVSAAIWLQLVDSQVSADGFGGTQTGHFFIDRAEKPAYRAYRFPFHADRTSKQKVKVWTIAPAAGRVMIEKQAGGSWQRVGGFAAEDGVPKQANVKLKGKQQLRANLGGETTIPVGVKKR